MRKIILIVHTSLDGFAADADGTFDNFNPSPENLDFVCSLTDHADAALAGRVSYQMLESFWPTARDKKDATPAEIKYSNWYNASEKIVISRTLTALHPQITFIADDIADKILKIKNQPGKNILMFGSPTTFETLHELNLIDEYWIIQYPVIFGIGITFFTRVRHSTRFDLVDLRSFSSGEIALHYKIIRNE